MVRVEERERIRRAYFIEKKTIRWIAREYRHSRRVVRKALRDSGVPVYRRKRPYVLPVIGPYVPIIEQWLLEEEGVPEKQRHTAHRIFTRLTEEQGFTGCESNVRRYVRLRRPRLDSVFTPIAHAIGEEAQVDFGEAQVYLVGRLTTVHLFCFQLCYSGRRFVRAYRTERQEEIDLWVASFQKEREKMPSLDFSKKNQRDIDLLIARAKQEVYNSSRGETRPESAQGKEDVHGAV